MDEPYLSVTLSRLARPCFGTEQSRLLGKPLLFHQSDTHTRHLEEDIGREGGRNAHVEDMYREIVSSLEKSSFCTASIGGGNRLKRWGINGRHRASLSSHTPDYHRVLVQLCTQCADPHVHNWVPRPT